MTTTCSWCGHPTHGPACPASIKAGRLEGRRLPRRIAGLKGELATTQPCPCRAAAA